MFLSEISVGLKIAVVDLPLTQAQRRDGDSCVQLEESVRHYGMLSTDEDCLRPGVGCQRDKY